MKEGLVVDPGAIFKNLFSGKAITFSEFHMRQKMISTAPIDDDFIFGPSLNEITFCAWRA